jgi:hypothetical protein
MSAGTGNVCRADAPDAPGVLATPPSATRIAEKMESVADVLHQKHTGDPVQGQQKTIVRDLDALIASLEKQCEACKNGIKRNNPRNGMLDSMISRGTGGIGTLVNANDAGRTGPSSPTGNGTASCNPCPRASLQNTGPCWSGIIAASRKRRRLQRPARRRSRQKRKRPPARPRPRPNLELKR